MSTRFYDAHNHLQDDRFGGRQAELLAAGAEAGIARMVVNGSCEADWPKVLELARQHPQILPSFGYHPWYVGERTPDWRKNLIRFLDEVPSAVGEIGLDRWKPDLPYEDQEEVFVAQLEIAAERNLPASIHCLRAWGRLYELLHDHPRPACGFLLHSFGGPKEMVPQFVKLGAYFSFPGYYAHERTTRQREAFKQVPQDRWLIETDAPDQLLPEASQADGPMQEILETNPACPLVDANTGKSLNHPAHLGLVYRYVAKLKGEDIEALTLSIEANFQRLFGVFNENAVSAF